MRETFCTLFTIKILLYFSENNIPQMQKKQCNPSLKKSFKERNPDVDMDEIQNNPNVPEDVKAAISGTLSAADDEEDGGATEGDTNVNEPNPDCDDFDDELFDKPNDSGIESKKRQRNNDDNGDDEIDEDWIKGYRKISKKKKKKKSKKGKDKKKDKKEKKEKKKKRESKESGIESCSPDTSEKRLKKSKRKKSIDINMDIDNKTECDKNESIGNVKRRKITKKKHYTDLTTIDLIIESVVNGYAIEDCEQSVINDDTLSSFKIIGKQNLDEENGLNSFQLGDDVIEKKKRKNERTNECTKQKPMKSKFNFVFLFFLFIPSHSL